MTYGEILLVLHIAGAGTWLGANVVQAVVPPVAARQGTEALAGWYRITTAMATRLYIPAAILILITGVLMVLDNEAFGFGTPFVTIGFGMIVVGALLGQFVFGPGGDDAAAAVESGDGTAIRRAVGKLTRYGLIDTLLLLFTITAMVLRLGFP
ncbi:MAG TPA: DUF2269 family protein [Acidimicrobiia bacterium]|nr:DUF2269 family protein [Acidimicrobiia bacterium]